jgi:orotate phosphoribosyltransferase
MKVFISHSSRDADFVSKLAQDLESNGIQPWYSEREIMFADSIIKRMNEGLKDSSYVIAVLSKSSIDSAWVTIELEVALYEEIINKKICLIPIILESCELPPLLKIKKYIDFRKEYKFAFEQLLSFLNKQYSYDDMKRANIGVCVNSESEIDLIFKVNPKYKEDIYLDFDKNNLSKLIIKSECLRKGKFLLTSGYFSNYYIMPRKIFEKEETKNFFVSILSMIINRQVEHFDAIIYPALTDGGMLGAILADKLNIKHRVPIQISHDKKEVKLRYLDIDTLINKNCLFVDDVITSGLSITTAIRELTNNHITPKFVVTLFSRDEVNYNALEKQFLSKGITLLTPFFAEIPPYEESNMIVTKVQTIN